MPNFVLISLFLFTTLVVAAPVSTEYDWVEKRDRDGILIYTSKVSGSKFKAVRGEMIVTGEVAQLVALVSDLPRCADWADLCKTSTALKVISPTEQIVHIHNNIPFPVKDRDVVAQMIWSRDSETGQVSMHSEALTKEQSLELQPRNKKAVRVYDARSEWHFTPLSGGQVRVENFAHIDPNGPMPAWLTNLLLVDSPYKTMRAMRTIIEAGEYAGTQLAF